MNLNMVSFFHDIHLLHFKRFSCIQMKTNWGLNLTPEHIWTMYIFGAWSVIEIGCWLHSPGQPKILFVS